VTHTELARDTRAGRRRGRPAARVPVAATGRRPASWIVIASCAMIALFLRGYQLARPGYLLGVTEYDDGVLFGNALRLVTGVIPYRDFSMVQPPGGMLLMVPAALLAKVAGTAWGLAAARLLTVGADTANVVLLGVLVRHRGPLTASLACGLYAVNPDAISAAHTFLLEPWLNLFCLLGAVAIFDRDRLVGTSPRAPGTAPRVQHPPRVLNTEEIGDAPRISYTPYTPYTPSFPRVSDNVRLVCGGLLFGFAVAVKIWAVVPLGIVGLLVVLAARRARPTAALAAGPARRVRPAAALAAGAAAGLAVPLLPFAVLAPGALARGVLVGQFVRNAYGSRHLLQRLSDLAGLGLHPVGRGEKLLLAAITAVLIGCCGAAYALVSRRCGERRARALDGYALACAAAVTAMLLWPRLYYQHYGSFDAPFLALALALPIGRLAAARQGNPPVAVAAGPATGARPARLRAALVVALVLLIAVAGYRQFRAESRLRGDSVAAAADRLIPAGSCVLANDPADTVTADRFYADVPGCPEIVDSFGTFIAMTGGRFRSASPAALQRIVALWQTALDRAQYVWLNTDTLVQIPWNRWLYGYFLAHFRVIGFIGPPVPYRNIPRPGLYARTQHPSPTPVPRPSGLRAAP